MPHVCQAFAAVVLASMLLLSHVVHGVPGFSGAAPRFRDYFYIGGQYVQFNSSNGGGSYFHNQMYVEKLSPVRERVQPYPIVFVHGGGQTGTVSSMLLQ